MMTPEQQWAAQGILKYLEDLFTEAGQESYTRESVLVLLNVVRNDASFFNPDLVAAFDGEATEQEMGR